MDSRPVSFDDFVQENTTFKFGLVSLLSFVCITVTPALTSQRVVEKCVWPIAHFFPFAKNFFQFSLLASKNVFAEARAEPPTGFWLV
jgi:hypothetical protein